MEQTDNCPGYDDASPAPSTSSSSVRSSNVRLPTKRKLSVIHEELLEETKRANSKAEELTEVANKLLEKANEIAERSLQLQEKLINNICEK